MWKEAGETDLTLTVLVTTIDAQWEGMGDVGSARYELALLPPIPDPKGFKLQLIVNFQKFSTLLRFNEVVQQESQNNANNHDKRREGRGKGGSNTE